MVINCENNVGDDDDADDVHDNTMTTTTRNDVGEDDNDNDYNYDLQLHSDMRAEWRNMTTQIKWGPTHNRCPRIKSIVMHCHTISSHAHLQ